MLSFTFNSNVAARDSADSKAVAGVLIVVLALLAAAEWVARYPYAKISQIQSRVNTERTKAEKIIPRTGARKASLLIVGNSLLLEGVDLPQFERELSPDLDVFRYVIESTTYYDWYFGLQHLFHAGSRPQFVILALNPSGMTSSSFRADGYAAYMLYDARDIPALAQLTYSDLTTTSGVMIAHFSAFYANRENLRGFVLGKLFPDYEQLIIRLLTKRARDMSNNAIQKISTPRLQMLRNVCHKYGSQFLFAIPPTRQPGDQGLIAAAQMAGVRVIAPIPNNTLEVGMYRDGLHLNERGSALFTKALAAGVRSSIRP